MKRICAIFFLLVFLFQVGGYYIVFWGMAHHAKQDLLKRLDTDNYSQSELVVLNIPMSLPYPVNSVFERVDGEFVHGGESYKLVKQKLENDTLFVVCIKDAQTSKISAAFTDFTKVTHNVPVNSKKAMSFLSKLYKDFKSTEFKMLYKSRVMFEMTYLTEATTAIATYSHTVESPPPELVF